MISLKTEKFLKEHPDYAGLILSNLHGRIVVDDERMEFDGNSAQEKELESIVGKLSRIEEEKGHIERADVIETVSAEKNSHSKSGDVYEFPKKMIKARTSGQKKYIDLLNDNELVISIGPAGTGKTYLAVAKALDSLLNRRMKKIILTRPAVEAGESLGFLPGDMKEKVDPYLRPLYDALYSMMERDRVERYIAEEIIEIAPLAYMRGRTLSDSYLILDEAQNTTSKQMKMFITRMGMNSRTIITGDITQIDLKIHERSGLIELMDLTRNLPDVGIVRLTTDDVVRHPLVKRIINAYLEKNDKEDN
ncbi:MAG: PhoH family protein [bacterium]